MHKLLGICKHKTFFKFLTLCTHSPMKVVEIVGTTQFSQGCSCEAHHISGVVVAVGIAVYFCKVQVMIEGGRVD